MLQKSNTTLIIVDVQGNLAHFMYEKERLFDNLQKIIKGIKVLEIPILWVEQNPQGLGPTITDVANLLTGLKPIAKQSFSCYQSDAFKLALNSINKKQILIAGIETHVCVYQTAIDLLENGFEVHIIGDAVSSRTKENKKLALQKMTTAGIHLTSVETALFELLKIAEGERFKKILEIVK